MALRLDIHKLIGAIHLVSAKASFPLLFAPSYATRNDDKDTASV